MKILCFIFISLFVSSVLAQTKKAEKIKEFNFIPCSHFMALVDIAFQDYVKTPNSKLYVIYYEGKTDFENIWNNKRKEFETKQIGVKRGQALNGAKEVVLYLKSRDFPESDVVLIDGGYREKFTLEIWLVPVGVEAPKPTPTVDEKDVTFRKGKPKRPRSCASAYDGY